MDSLFTQKLAYIMIFSSLVTGCSLLAGQKVLDAMILCIGGRDHRLRSTSLHAAYTWRRSFPATEPILRHVACAERLAPTCSCLRSAGAVLRPGATGTCALAGASASSAATYSGCAAVTNGLAHEASAALFSYSNATCSYPSAPPCYACLSQGMDLTAWHQGTS